MSQDPIGFGAGDANLYRYVFNNPVNLTDPDGKIIPLIVAEGLRRCALGAAVGAFGGAHGGIAKVVGQAAGPVLAEATGVGDFLGLGLNSGTSGGNCDDAEARRRDPISGATQSQLEVLTTVATSVLKGAASGCVSAVFSSFKIAKLGIGALKSFGFGLFTGAFF